MGTLNAFNFITLNGFYKGANGDISWHKDNDPEKDAYAMEGLQSDSTLLFGRVTYELMAGFWPSPDALQFAPAMAEGMNKAEKIVFSTTLKDANRNNTQLVKSNMIEKVQQLKQQPGKNMTILGSGNIITQLAEEGLIDEFLFMVDPVVIGKGTPIFNNIHHSLQLELVSTRSFKKSGAVLLCYRPLNH
jgi:dihydrofolate reductase